MQISCREGQRILYGRGCDPDVIFGNRFALLAEQLFDLPIVSRRIFNTLEHPGIGTQRSDHDVGVEQLLTSHAGQPVRNPLLLRRS